MAGYGHPEAVLAIGRHVAIPARALESRSHD
jgi:hypothetical protein